MYELHVDRVFSATHALRLYDGTLEQPHAHDWHTTVTVAAPDLDAIEVVIDFHELERIIDGVLSDLSGADLNAHPSLAGMNPSAERVAEVIFRRIASLLPGRVALRRVTVTEAPGCRASYTV